MIRQNRKVLLLLDNAPCHPEVELANVKMIHLPPNTTSDTQQLDSGIIKNFKVKYHQLLLNYVIASNEFK